MLFVSVLGPIRPYTVDAKYYVAIGDVLQMTNYGQTHPFDRENRGIDTQQLRSLVCRTFDCEGQRIWYKSRF